ncbi:MAG: nucleoside hydrolase [Chloroflexota bacterium]
MPQRTPIILDVDTGIDDSLALLYAAGSEDAELVAATCVFGNTEAATAARNTQMILELAGRGDVEVALGCEQLLHRPLRTAPETHGPLGLGHAELPAPRGSLSPRSGPDLIVAEARSRPGEITLITLGPLTNLAVALEREPDLPRLLGGYALMGGAYRASGNTTPTTEWNIHCDPDAARAVFRAWGAAAATNPAVSRPLALGLDVTEQGIFLPSHLERLTVRAGAANPIVRYMTDALRFYMEFHERYDGFYGAFVHDPMAVAATLDRTLVRTEAVHVDVETSGDLTAGMTVADWRHLTGQAPNLDVAVEADASTFLDRLIDRIGGLAVARSGMAL